MLTTIFDKLSDYKGFRGLMTHNIFGISRVLTPVSRLFGSVGTAIAYDYLELRRCDRRGWECRSHESTRNARVAFRGSSTPQNRAYLGCQDIFRFYYNGGK